LEKSSYYVFGGEESYGYSGGDFVRDKDGNGAAIMFCEIAAYAKSLGLTVDGLLDIVYSEFGYFCEFTGSLTFEGAEGAATITRLLSSYVSNPPGELLGAKLVRVRNFETDTCLDVEGDEIPKEKMFVFEFGNQTRIAVRASGTEPKIKYYLFAQRQPSPRLPSVAEMAVIKEEVRGNLARVWGWLRDDASRRAG
jgi:phosphoglucomutase